mgnify:CR=1 FL=1
MASKEVALEDALNSVDTARVALLKQLNLDTRTQIKPVADLNVPQVDLEYEDLLPVAFANRTDWLNSLLTLKDLELGILVAENSRLWQLDATGGYSYKDTRIKHGDDSDTNTWDAGLSLTAPLWGQGELRLRQDVQSARIAYRKQQISHEQLKRDIEIDVQNAVRDVERKRKSWQLARRATDLSRRTLEAEQERLSFGRSTNFKVVSFQNDLLSAQNSELTALINYLNALNSLDQTLGTTLNTWQVDFAPQDPALLERYEP